MILEILLIMLLFGMITFMKSVETKSIIYSAVSLMIFIMILAASMGIEVPGVTNIYQDFTVNILSFGMIILNIIWIILTWMGLAVDIRYRI